MEMRVLGAASDQRYILIQDFHTGDEDCGCALRRTGQACDAGRPAVSRVLATEAREFMERRMAVVPRPWGRR